MNYNNELFLKFKSLSENEGFARACVASFCLPLNPSIEVITDIKTAVSEAVTNCVVHAYPNKVGEPFYTSKPDSERSGMGFTVMESFMDSVVVNSEVNKGTEVVLVKNLEDNKLAVGG